MNNPYILMLESDNDDREVTRKFFENNALNIGVEFLNYSHEVIPYLKLSLTLPALILMRMNAVPETGLLVLGYLKASKAYQHLPVIILGENTQPWLIEKCYAAGANSVINKPFTFDEANIKINSFIHYWFNVAELPNRQELIQKMN
jgi:CheY-like chemotaxis protein